MYQFCYDYVKLEYGENKKQNKTKLHCMDRDSFIPYIKTEHIYVENLKDVEKRFHTANYESERPLPRRKKRKILNQRKMNLKSWNAFSRLGSLKRICYAHNKFKTRTKSWNSFEKMHRAIKLSQKSWLKPYIDTNTEIRKKAKNDFEKYFFKFINNVVFQKNMKNVSKHRDIKLVTTETRGNYLVSESNYHKTKSFFWTFIGNRNKKNNITIYQYTGPFRSINIENE